MVPSFVCLLSPPPTILPMFPTFHLPFPSITTPTIPSRTKPTMPRQARPQPRPRTPRRSACQPTSGLLRRLSMSWLWGLSGRDFVLPPPPTPRSPPNNTSPPSSNRNNPLPNRNPTPNSEPHPDLQARGPVAFA